LFGHGRIEVDFILLIRLLLCAKVGKKIKSSGILSKKMRKKMKKDDFLKKNEELCRQKQIINKLLTIVLCQIDTY